MKRAWLAWVSIGKCEVDGDGETNLTASKDILKERVSLLDLQLSEDDLVLIAKGLLLIRSERVLLGSLLHLAQSQSNLSNVLVLATLCRLEEVKSHLLINIVSGNVRREDIHQVPVV